MEKRYLGKVELNYDNATVTIWEINPDKEDNALISVWDIAGSPGWTWAFQIDGRPWVSCGKGNPGYEEIYKVCPNYQEVETEEQVKAIHSRVLDVASETDFLDFVESNYDYTERK